MEVRMSRKVWTHKDLDVYQQALDLAEETYRVTRAFPREEPFWTIFADATRVDFGDQQYR
jgi:23S rRNA-intervening sequence protein